jgi:ATP-dependent Clp endopeptidase proteolytic subunit ClpP
MPKKTKSSKEKEETTEQNILDILASTPPGAPPMRAVSLFGNLDDDQVQEVCQGLLYLKHTCYEGKQPDDPHTSANPIKFYISTWGGDALGMFAIYDLMRMMRADCPIFTYGIGKVMSAGVLLLAAGTKGERRVGRHTRIMMHSVRGGHYGAIHSLENEMNETRYLQNQHIDALVEETNLTKRKLNNMLNKKLDVYLSAEEAVELGIADIIV